MLLVRKKAFWGVDCNLQAILDGEGIEGLSVLEDIKTVHFFPTDESELIDGCRYALGKEGDDSRYRPREVRDAVEGLNGRIIRSNYPMEF